jgi:hypothetical protein
MCFTRANLRRRNRPYTAAPLNSQSGAIDRMNNAASRWLGMEDNVFGKKEDKTTAAVKKLSPKDAMAEQIEAVTGGEEITFKLGQIYVKPYVTVVHNPSGKRFTVYQDGKDDAGNPAGKRGKFWDTEKAKDIAGWILEREGQIYKA